MLFPFMLRTTLPTKTEQWENDQRTEQNLHARSVFFVSCASWVCLTSYDLHAVLKDSLHATTNSTLVLSHVASRDRCDLYYF